MALVPVDRELVRKYGEVGDEWSGVGAAHRWNDASSPQTCVELSREGGALDDQPPMATQSEDEVTVRVCGDGTRRVSSLLSRIPRRPPPSVNRRIREPEVLRDSFGLLPVSFVDRMRPYMQAALTPAARMWVPIKKMAAGEYQVQRGHLVLARVADARLAILVATAALVDPDLTSPGAVRSWVRRVLRSSEEAERWVSDYLTLESLTPCHRFPLRASD